MLFVVGFLLKLPNKNHHKTKRKGQSEDTLSLYAKEMDYAHVYVTVYV